MNRRQALVTIGVGGAAAAFTHPKTRKASIKGYKMATIKITPVRVPKETRKSLCGIFNFRSKKEEEATINELKKIMNRERKKKNEILFPEITFEILRPLMEKVERERWEYARGVLQKSNLGKVEKKKAKDRLGKFFRGNKKINRVPSEKEVLEIIENRAHYTIR